MLQSWVELGQNPDGFWSKTPKLIKMIMDASVKRLERDVQLAERTAWQTANLVMIGHHDPKNFPKFEKFSSRKSKRKNQSETEIKNIVRMMNGMFGGSVEAL